MTKKGGHSFNKKKKEENQLVSISKSVCLQCLCEKRNGGRVLRCVKHNCNERQSARAGGERPRKACRAHLKPVSML